MNALRQIYEVATAAGMNRMLLGGSFVTSKPAPGDVDGVLFGGSTANWNLVLPFVQPRPNERSLPEVDLYVATDAQAIDYWQRIYGADRRGLPRGVIDLPLLNPPATRLIINPDISDDLLDVQIDKARHEMALATSAIQREALTYMLVDLEEKKKSRTANGFYEQCLRTEIVKPGKDGIGDPQINSLIGLLSTHFGAMTVIDYGCGGGRFAAELATLDPALLSQTTYLGLDFAPEIAVSAAAELGLHERLRKVEYTSYADAQHWTSVADFVVMVNVLHEVPLVQLAPVVAHAVRMVKPGGYLVIHDMEHLVEGERGFAPWSGDEAAMLLRSDGIDLGLRRHQSRRGIPFYTLHAQVHSTVALTKDELEKRALEVYRRKEERLIRERRELTGQTANARLYAYLSVAIANVREQVWVASSANP